MKLKSGHEVIPTTEEETNIIKKYFPQYQNGAIRLSPGGWFFLPKFTKYADQYYSFKFKPTDVVIMSWPKCGTTWTQEIVWTMMHDRNYDNESVKVPINVRSPFLEYDFVREGTGSCDLGEPYSGIQFLEEICGEKSREGVALQVADKISDPRIIKTHLAFSLLNPNLLDTCKVIYVARNPKDAFCSYLHHHFIINKMKFEGNLSEFLDFYLNDSVLHSPFWENIKEAWERRNHKNFLWLFYEKMIKDPMKELKRINEFLEVDMKENELYKLYEYTQFDKMKKRNPIAGSYSKIHPASEAYKNGGFFRKGKVGNWKEKLTGEENNRLDKWIADKSKEIDFSFEYE